MATTNLGRVGLVPKGAYNAATAYKRLDFVTYQGSSYVAIKDTTGHAPTDATYWQPLADVSGATSAINSANAAATAANAAAKAANDAATGIDAKIDTRMAKLSFEVDPDDGGLNIIYNE